MTHDRLPNTTLVGIDSDGCVFDTMEVKHKECFTPNVIKHFGLQGVSKYAREACDFVNLYSKSRGINRFPALIEDAGWTARPPEVLARGVKIASRSGRDWVARSPSRAIRRLEGRRRDGRPGPEAPAGVVEGGEPRDGGDGPRRAAVPLCPRGLEKMFAQADILVVSATPHEALQREWDEHDLTRYVVEICGQEMGTKKECLQAARNYPPCHTLMIGDAPGDYKAAVANGALFFPINPGAEEASWKRLLEEGLDRFFAGTFAGKYQEDCWPSSIAICRKCRRGKAGDDRWIMKEPLDMLGCEVRSLTSQIRIWIMHP